VVAAALDALESGQRTITPGLVNRLSTYVVRVSPRSVGDPHAPRRSCRR
jgi:hypothetical protein